MQKLRKASMITITFIAPVITEVCFAIQVQWIAKELRDAYHLIP